jgi:hypothetical protein
MSIKAVPIQSQTVEYGTTVRYFVLPTPRAAACLPYLIALLFQWCATDGADTTNHLHWALVLLSTSEHFSHLHRKWRVRFRFRYILHPFAAKYSHWTVPARLFLAGQMLAAHAAASRTHPLASTEWAQSGPFASCRSAAGNHYVTPQSAASGPGSF